MIRTAFLRSFDWSGRAPRRELWAFLAFAALLLLAVATAELWLTNQDVQSPRGVYLVGSALFIPGVSILVRRLHDRGRSSGWIILVVIPLVRLVLVAYLLLVRGQTRRDPPDAPVVLHGLAVLAAASVTLLIAGRAFWHPSVMLSGSMKPGLLVGDYVISRYVQPDDLRRGDVIVFRNGDAQGDQTSRLIGLPGDTVQMKDGVVFINGAAAVQQSDGQFVEIYENQGPLGHPPRCGNAPVGAGGRCKTDRATETLPGGNSHAVLNIAPGRFGDNTSAVNVPKDQFFVLGDNRDDSIDSRIAAVAGGVGFVPAENLIARADRILVSSAGRALWAVWAWRADRTLMAIE